MICDQKFEAENGNLSGLFQIYNNAEFSGGAYVDVPNSGLYVDTLGNSYAEYKLVLAEARLVKIQTGVKGPSGSDNSFWVTIDGQPAGGYLYDTPDDGVLQSDYVSDRNGLDGGDPVKVSLAAGEHVIRFYLREDGTKLDWLKAECDAVSVPSIDIRKQAEGPDSRTFSSGDTVPFQIVVTNTGGVDLTDVMVSDPLVPACNNTIGSLAAGQSVTYSCETSLAGSSSTDTYRDEFNQQDYDNNDGSANFSGNWVEHDKADGYSQNPLSGNVLVGSNYKLWLDDSPDTGTDPSAKRTADLSGATSATLAFDWETHSGVDTSDKVVVEISSDGGSSYTELEAFTGFSGAMSGSRSFDISAYISSETTVRFRVALNYGGLNETFKVDNLTITAVTNTVAEGFNNEACVIGSGSGLSVSDCDTSEVVVDDSTPPSGCGSSCGGYDGHKEIRVSHSGKCLDVSGVSYADGAKVHQWSCHGGDNQKWSLIPHASGAYQLKAKHSGKCLDGSLAKTGGDSMQWSCASATDSRISEQLFYLESNSDGSYRIKHKDSSKCLDVEGSSTYDGAKILLWSSHTGGNQRWSMN
ncbi:MAG: RICIN domain-containing protein [Chromatiaceae bacterium]|nr:RICIN domain-containing protein [Chromatiaceae bacterium]